jgi:hypothetical protein
MVVAVKKHWVVAATLAVLGVVLALLAPRWAGSALGQGTVVRVVSPGTASVGGTVEVRIEIQSVTGLGSYEWFLTYDSNILQLTAPADGGFLGSTGRSVYCPPAILDTGTVRFGCVTAGTTPDPPSGSGLLSTVTFNALTSGSTSLCLSWAQLSDTLGDDIPTGVAHASIAVGGGSAPAPSCEAPATPTPGATNTPTTGDTPVPPVATATAEPPPATATPAGPTPTPAPTPPPEQSDWVELAALCNPVSITYPDGTTVQTLTAAVTPSGILTAVWKLQAGVWLGYSPEYPQASNLAATGFLDVVFLCVDGAGTFVRPLV